MLYDPTKDPDMPERCTPRHHTYTCVSANANRLGPCVQSELDRIHASGKCCFDARCYCRDDMAPALSPESQRESDALADAYFTAQRFGPRVVVARRERGYMLHPDIVTFTPAIDAAIYRLRDWLADLFGGAIENDRPPTFVPDRQWRVRE